MGDVQRMKDMGYEISLSDSGRYLVVRVRENITLELARAYAADATLEAQKRGLDRFLFDVRQAPNVETSVSNYKFAYQDMAELELSRSARSAILTDPSDHSHDFVETVAKNAGYNVGLFKSEEQAIAWLEELL